MERLRTLGGQVGKPIKSVLYQNVSAIWGSTYDACKSSKAHSSLSIITNKDEVFVCVITKLNVPTGRIEQPVADRYDVRWGYSRDMKCHSPPNTGVTGATLGASC